MPLENPSVVVNGRTFNGWIKIAVHAGIKHAARALQLTFVDTLGAPQAAGAFPTSSLIQVYAGHGELMFTGFRDKLRPKIDEKGYFVEVCARSKGADAVDSSVDHTKPDYTNSNVLNVAKDQDKFGIGFTADIQLDGFDLWRPNVGDTFWEALVPLCEDEGCTMFGQPDGSIKITQAGATAKQQSGYLAEGYPGPGGIWKGEAHIDDSAKHSKIQSHGQAFQGNGNQSIQLMGSADNDQVKRFRPYIEHHDRQTSRDRLLKRASRRRDREQGEGNRAVITTRGWRDQGGKLWTPGNTVFVVSASLYLTQTMLIETAVYDQGGEPSEGSITTLHLVDPQAHGGKSGTGVNQSDSSVWGFDDSQAE